MQGENETPPNDQMFGLGVGKRQYTLFQGHSGPVYAASFSPVGDFILSSSADSTSRLSHFCVVSIFFSLILVSILNLMYLKSLCSSVMEHQT